MEDIGNIYGLAPRYVSGLIYKNPIPKMRKGNKGYYSKTHFDQLMKEKFPQPEYYTIEEALSQFDTSREAPYKLIKRYSVTTIKEGRSLKIAKQELDLVMSNKKQAK